MIKFTSLTVTVFYFFRIRPTINSELRNWYDPRLLTNGCLRVQLVAAQVQDFIINEFRIAQLVLSSSRNQWMLTGSTRGGLIV